MIARISRRVVASGDKSGYHGSHFSVTVLSFSNWTFAPNVAPELIQKIASAKLCFGQSQ